MRGQKVHPAIHRIVRRHIPGCLTDAEKTILSRVRDQYVSLATIPCTACAYCMPCPQGVAISDIFSRFNDGMMFNNFDMPKGFYNFFITNVLKADATKCIECGECETKCPQNIAIMQELKNCHAKFTS